MDPRHAVLIHPLAEQPGSRFQFANGRREIRLLPSPTFCKQSGHETEQRTDPNNEACIYTRASIPRIQTRVHSCAQQERMEDSGELSHFSPSRGRTRDPRGGEREREREKKNENLRLVRGKKSSNQEPSLPSAGERVQRIAVQKRRTTPRVIIRFAGATFNQQPAYFPSASSSLAFDQTFRAVPRWKKYLSRSYQTPSRRLPFGWPVSTLLTRRWTDRMNESAEEEEKGEASSWFVGWQWKLNTVQLLLACPTGLCLLN